jgi:hypothetical protein
VLNSSGLNARIRELKQALQWHISYTALDLISPGLATTWNRLFQSEQWLSQTGLFPVATDGASQLCRAPVYGSIWSRLLFISRALDFLRKHGRRKSCRREERNDHKSRFTYLIKAIPINSTMESHSTETALKISKKFEHYWIPIFSLQAFWDIVRFLKRVTAVCSNGGRRNKILQVMPILTEQIKPFLWNTIAMGYNWRAQTIMRRTPSAKTSRTIGLSECENVIGIAVNFSMI